MFVSLARFITLEHDRWYLIIISKTFSFGIILLERSINLKSLESDNDLITSFFSPHSMQSRYATRSILFAVYSLCDQSKYSINTCLVSSLLNLFVSRWTHRYIIILGQHHRFPGYFCGWRVNERTSELASSLARSLRTLLLHFVQYHFTIVVPPTSSRFHSSPSCCAPRPRLHGFAISLPILARVLLWRHKRRTHDLPLRISQRG